MRLLILLVACLPSYGALGITLIGSAPDGAGNTVTTITTTAGCAVGSSVVLITDNDAATTPTFSAVDTASGSGSGTNTYSGVGSGPFFSAGTTIYMQFLSSDNISHALAVSDTITITSSVAKQFGREGIAFCVTGTATSPRDLAAAGQAGGGFNTSVVSGTFTTNASTPNEIVLMAFNNTSSGVATFTAGTNYTTIFNSGSNFSVGVEYRIISSQLSGSTATATLSGNNNWATTVMSLTQASSARIAIPKVL